MKKLVLILILALIGGGISLAQMMGNMPMMRNSMIRHRYVMMNGIPNEYRNLSNPIRANKENIKAGEKLYNTYCALCHGTKGYGDGPAGQTLNPSPSNIASAVCMPMAADSYLFWTIAEGGKNRNTAMPSFKESLSKEDIWKIILYVRSELSDCWGERWGMWIFMIVVWILIILAAVAIFKWVTNFKAQSSESALDIIKKRYAKGEISEEEFNKMKEKITERRDLK
jgi:uncharacterized membrane protein